MEILYVTTVSVMMNFFVKHVEMLIEEGNTVSIASNCEDGINPVFEQMGCKIYNIPFSRKPVDIDNIKAVIEFHKLISKHDFDIIHTHSPNASAIVRLVCANKRRKHHLKVFYTAHGFHFYKGAPLKTWLLFYPVEKICSFFTDVLITINHEDYKFAQKHLNSKKTVFVPGVGIDIDKFANANVDRSEVRASLGINDEDFLLLNVGELSTRKNQVAIINALADIDDGHIKCIIAGEGPEHAHYEELIADKGLKDRVILLGLRNDVERLYKISDAFIFPSVHEGLPVAVMEAMASGLPVICSDIRGSKDVIDNKKGGFLIRTGAYSKAINILIRHPELKDKMGSYNQGKIIKYGYKRVLNKMKQLYLE